jgi:hypothetical protein
MDRVLAKYEDDWALLSPIVKKLERLARFVTVEDFAEVSQMIDNFEVEKK